MDLDGQQALSTEEMTNRWNDEGGEGIVETDSSELSANQVEETPLETTHFRDFDDQYKISRDPATGKPIYSQMVKGGYKGTHYRVQAGDSMFFIAYISGKSVDHIAKLNDLTAPYHLRVGQVLRLSNDVSVHSQRDVNENTPHIPRNAQTNKPEYNKMEKGFYRGDTYTVHQGDTLYLVSYISGRGVDELAQLNHLTPPYDLHAGQVLRLSNNTTGRVHTTIQMKKTPTQTQTVKTTTTISPSKQVAPIKKTNVTAEKVKFAQHLQWQWPTQGKVIDGFSSTDGGNKGIDIAGSLGQAVRAASSGQVVYAGNALQGYGNLIIIKHNNDYLSAYAHNQQILVKDKQWVKAGQEIATMGRSGTDKVKLHFEVRYKGQSTNPMKFLPKQ